LEKPKPITEIPKPTKTATDHGLKNRNRATLHFTHAWVEILGTKSHVFFAFDGADQKFFLIKIFLFSYSLNIFMQNLAKYRERT
jgi:hypothetical protein